MFFFGKKRREQEAAEQQRLQAEAEAKAEADARAQAAAQAIVNAAIEAKKAKFRKALEEKEARSSMDTRGADQKAVYALLCTTLDDMKLYYEKNEEEYLVEITIETDTLPVRMGIWIEEEQRAYLVSPLPFVIPKEKRAEGAAVICIANYAGVNGSFNYDLDQGEIEYRVSQQYEDCRIRTDMFREMILYTYAVVTRYSTDLLAFSKGMMSLEQFMEKYGRK